MNRCGLMGLQTSQSPSHLASGMNNTVVPCSVPLKTTEQLKSVFVTGVYSGKPAAVLVVLHLDSLAQVDFTHTWLDLI